VVPGFPSRRAIAELALGFCFALLVTNSALAKPVRSLKPIEVKGSELATVTISNLVVKADAVDDILIVKEKYVVMFLEEMRRLGYRAVGRENLAMNQDRSEDAAFVLGGTMTEVDCADEQRLTCGVSIEWQLMDRKSSAIVYRVTARYEEMNLRDLERTSAGDRLLMGGLRALLARPKFVEALKTGASTAPATPGGLGMTGFATGQVRACPTHELNMPKQSNDALRATVLLKVAGGVGSGVIVSPDGLILTAAHVVSTDDVTVLFKSGEERPATVLRVNEAKDVALIQLKDSHADTPCLTLRTRAPDTGEDVFALGAPGGEKLSFSVARGIVSGRRTLDGNDFLQTDASVSPGNSGGPLVDAKGQVVAIMSWKVTGNATEGLSFGVPSVAALAALGLEFGEQTGSLLVKRDLAVATVAASGVVDQADPPWFYVGDKAPGKTPGWVGQVRGWGWTAAVVGGVTVGTTALLGMSNASPTGFRTARTWNTVGWGLTAVGAGMVVTSYVFGGGKTLPATGQRAPRMRLAARLGSEEMGPASLSISGAF
jgi:serine protease Do